MAYLRRLVCAYLIVTGCAPAYWLTREPVAAVCVRSQAYPILRARLFVERQYRGRVTLGGFNETHCWRLQRELVSVVVRVNIMGHDWYRQIPETTVPTGGVLWVEVSEQQFERLHLLWWIE